MIGVKVLLVVFTFTNDNRLFTAINEGAFISFVSTIRYLIGVPPAN